MNVVDQIKRKLVPLMLSPHIKYMMIQQMKPVGWRARDVFPHLLLSNSEAQPNKINTQQPKRNTSMSHQRSIFPARMRWSLLSRLVFLQIPHPTCTSKCASIFASLQLIQLQKQAMCTLNLISVQFQSQNTNHSSTPKNWLSKPSTVPTTLLKSNAKHILTSASSSVNLTTSPTLKVARSPKQQNDT